MLYMKNKPVLIGISGGSASGKSTLSRMISERLENYKSEIINADKYYKRDDMPQMISPLTGVPGLDWNTPAAIDIDAMLAYLNEKLADASYDFIIIEGAFIFCYEKLHEMCDLKIFIDLDSDIRMYRRIKRNMAVRGLSLEEIGDYFTEYAKFSEQKYSLTTKVFADIVVNGHNFDKLALDMLVMYIISKKDQL